MTLYQYVAVNEKGVKQRGVLNADHIHLAKSRLKEMGLFVIKLSISKARRGAFTLPAATVLSFTRDLSLLLRSLPLYESLLTLEEKYRGQKIHFLLTDLCELVRQGTDLSKALALYPRVFDHIYVTLIRTAEETGNLERVFDHLATLITNQCHLKKQLINALLYPAFLATFCFAIFCGLFFFLIPTMSELFEDRALHPMTAAVIGLSRFLNEHLFSLVTITTAGVAGLILWRKTEHGKRIWKASALKIPILKRMTTEAVLIRFSGVLSTLLSNKVPFLESLSFAKNAMYHPIFEAVITRAESKVEEGKKLSDELKSSPLMPPLFVRMLAVGEEGGEVDIMLKHLSQIYAEDLEKSLQRFTSLLQPILLLFMGFVVGLVVLSVLLPLTDAGSFLN